MSALLGEATGFLDKYLISGALSQASGDALRPLLQDIVNQAWADHAVLPPPAVLLAEGVAQGQVSKKAAYAWAKEQGYDTTQMDALVNIANVGPALGQAFQAWRRVDPATGQTLLSDAEFKTVLKRLAIEDQWVDAIMALKTVLLEPAEIAKAIHRGIMEAPDLLIAQPPKTPGHVPSVPPSKINAVHESAGAGIDAERLRIMVGNAGLPLGLHEMLSLLNRGYMTASDVQRGIAESNLRNEYQDVALQLARQLLTPHEYAELYIRGWISHDAMQAGGALHGVTGADMDLLAQMIGRPLVVHQVTTGLARGGSFGGNYEGVPEPYLTALRQSNVRPEWGSLAYANRYSLPGAFVIRALLKDGALTEAQGEQLFLEEGWPPDLAHTVAAYYSQATGTAPTSTHVKSAVTRLYTALHTGFVNGNIDESYARQTLAEQGEPASTIDTVLATWTRERAVALHATTAPSGPLT